MRKHLTILVLLLCVLYTTPAFAGLYIDGIPQGSSGGGTGAVSSVNGQTGDVILTTGNISPITDRNYISDSQLVTLSATSGTNTGDETKATIEAKLVGTYEPVLPVTPENPTSKYLNGNKVWTEISIGSGGYAANVYFTETPSSVVPAYKQLSYILPSVVTHKSATVRAGEGLIDSYIFDSPLGITTIDPGSWFTTMYSYVSATTGLTQFRIDVYKRSAGGVETFLFSKLSGDINSTSETPYKAETINPVFYTLPTDYLVAKVYGLTDSASDKTIYYTIGDGSASYINTPLAMRHSQLRVVEQAGAGVTAGHISADAQVIAGSKTFTSPLTVDGTLTVNGNIVQSGDAYETHAEQLMVEKSNIILRDSAVSALGSGEVSGVTVTKASGTLDGVLGIDNGGNAIAGLVGNTKTLAAREPNPVDGKVPVWNAGTQTFETANSPTTIAGYGITDALTLGATSTTAYRGDRGASAYAHSILADGTNPHLTAFANIASKPTTVAGYGITDGVTLTGTETLTNKTLANPVFTGNLDTTAYAAVIRSSSGDTLFKNAGNGQVGQIGGGGIVVGSYEKNAFAQFNGADAAVQMKFANNATGKSTTDAFDVGIITDGTAEIRQRENKPLNVYTNNVLAATFGVDKSLTLPSLAGTGNRMVVADSSGNLSASGTNTYTPTLSFQVGQVGSFTQSGTGSYVITGNMVRVIFSINTSAKPSAGSFLAITLPIPRKPNSTLCGHFSRYVGINVSTTADFIGLVNYGGDYSNAWIIKVKNDGSDIMNGVDSSELNAGISIQGVIDYEI